MAKDFKSVVILVLLLFAFFELSTFSKVIATSKRHVYHGKIKEDAKEGEEVHLNPPLTVRNWNQLTENEICGYTLYKSREEQPFRIDLQNHKTGEARIVLDTGYTLDYEKNHKYDFEIAAYDCVSGLHAARERVHIKVEDVNEYPPVWEQTSYSGSIEEEKWSDEGIIKVKATDADGSKINSRICQFRITTPEVPFEIDENGYIRNTELLRFDSSQQFSLEVTAEDCSGKVSDKVTVNIDVKEKCKPRWTNFVENVDVIGPLMKQQLMPSANLETCNISCEPIRVTVNIKLDTSHIGIGCDRDVYSLQSHRKICGSEPGGVELIPRPSTLTSWTRGVPASNTLRQDTVVNFDGKTTAIDVPLEGAEPLTSSKLTFSTWMRHEKNDLDPNPHGTKEQIICLADGDGMNRHHFSVYVQNCRLVLLLRQEPVVGHMSAGTLSPAEWRWTIPEVCDGLWHHYAITVERPKILLYVDGKMFEGGLENPEVLDDWPLHSSAEVHFTKLTLGACWQGGKNRMGFFLRGDLMGLSLIKNHTDSEEVIRCLTSCQEKLEITKLDEMDTGMSVSINSEHNAVTVVGLTLSSVERLVRNVFYVNSRLSPTVGTRSVSLKTQVQCSDVIDKIQVMDVKQDVMLYETEQILITLNGSTLIHKDEKNYEKGELLFKELVITASIKSTEFSNSDNIQGRSEAKDLSPSYLVDSCAVEASPQLKMDSERFVFPLDSLKQFGLELASNERGFIIAGAEKTSTYQEVLKQVEYVISKTKEVNEKVFTLTCTEVNQHLLSNPLSVKVEVIHRAPEKLLQPPHAKMMMNKADHPVMMDNQRLLSNGFPSSLKYDTQETGIGVAVVMVVCVGFVLILIVLGIIRVRNAQRNEDDLDKQQWDSSGLTITVNPMDPDNHMRRMKTMEYHVTRMTATAKTMKSCIVTRHQPGRAVLDRARASVSPSGTTPWPSRQISGACLVNNDLILNHSSCYFYT